MNVAVQTSIYYHHAHNQVFASEYIQHVNRVKIRVMKTTNPYDTHG